jgi:hypothetical protein
MLIRRSRNSYILARRSVTLQPIGQPSRILNEATETRALVTSPASGRDLGHVAHGVLQHLLVAAASPTPMLSVILVSAALA